MKLRAQTAIISFVPQFPLSLLPSLSVCLSLTVSYLLYFVLLRGKHILDTIIVVLAEYD